MLSFDFGEHEISMFSLIDSHLNKIKKKIKKKKKSREYKEFNLIHSLQACDELLAIQSN